MKVCFLSIVLFCSFNYALAQKGVVSINLTDSRRIITRNIDKNLVLRLIKDRSVTQENFGWLIEVVRRPATNRSRNLIYTNKLGVGADPSQVMAWQISDQDKNFPVKRRFKFRGYSYTVEIRLLDAQAEGKTSDARFISGKLEITWHH